MSLSTQQFQITRPLQKPESKLTGWYMVSTNTSMNAQKLDSLRTMLNNNVFNALDINHYTPLGVESQFPEPHLVIVNLITA